MDRAAFSDLRRGTDQSRGGVVAPLRETQRLLFALYFPTCLSLSFLIIFSIWKCAFAMSVHSKTYLLTVQRPKKSTTSDSWLLPIPLSASLVTLVINSNVHKVVSSF